MQNFLRSSCLAVYAVSYRIASWSQCPQSRVTSMVDLNDPEILKAVADVRDPSSDTDWLVLSYKGNNKLVVEETGSGGIEDLAEELDEGNVSYALLRVADPVDAKLVKMVQVMFVGPTVNGVLRGQSNSHRDAVKQVLGQPHIEMQTDDKDELTHAALVAKLKSKGGATGPGLAAASATPAAAPSSALKGAWQVEQFAPPTAGDGGSYSRKYEHKKVEPLFKPAPDTGVFKPTP